jgi:putative spermidine/putrescine transport system substrate-binding protein
MRRQFGAPAVWILAFAVVAAILANSPQPAPAAKGRLVVAAWGGQNEAAWREYVAKPFEKETGIQVIFTSPPDIAKIKAMVMTKNVEWDLAAAGLAEAMTLQQEGVLEEIDYSALEPKDVAGIDPRLRRPFWLASSAFSEVIAYRTDAFRDRAPQTWAEFFDAKRFPGPRGFRSAAGFPPPLEQLLLADGVPPDKLYPLDVDRAFRVLDRVRSLVQVWWDSWQQPFQLLADREVVLTPGSANRMLLLQRQGASVDLTYNQAILHWDGWVLPKGGNREAALRFLAVASRAEVQANRSQFTLTGHPNGRMYDHVPADVARRMNTSPENLQRQIFFDEDWWAAKGPDGKTNRVWITERWKTALIK